MAATANQVYQGLINRGIPENAAKGFVGNYTVESGLNTGINEISPTVPGSRGGFGLAQWTGPRRRQFETFAKSKGKPLDDLDVQLDFTAWELANTEKRAAGLIYAAQTPEDAARLISTKFLRPGIPHLDRRIAATRQFTGAPAGDMSQSAAPMTGGGGSTAMTGGGALDTLIGDPAGDTLAAPAATAVPDDYDPDAGIARLLAQPETTPADVYSANAPVPVEFDAAVPSDFDPAASAAALAELAQGGQRQAIATTDDGGIVYKGGDGSLSFSSPGYSTADPQVISRIMEGAKPVDMMQQQLDQERIDRNPIAARGIKAVEGVPFIGSFADEAIGAFSPEAGANTRAVSAAMDRQNPGESMALGVAGSVAGAVPMALAAIPSTAVTGATTVGSRAVMATGAGAVAGGIEGAVYGSGQQQGEGRAQNATSQGILGTLAGGALGFAAPFVGKAVEAAFASLRGSDVGAISRVLGVGAPAARVIKEALDAGDPAAAMAELRRAGDTAMLADAGQPARELLDAAANAGGNAGRIATDAVDARVTAASAEMQTALNKALGAPVGIETGRSAIRTQTAAARKLAYDTAYAQPINYATPRGQALLGMLQNRVPKSAFARANALMATEGTESAQKLFKIADDGSISVDTLPDVRQIDYLTRALQDVAEESNAKGKLGGQTDIGRATERLKTDIRNIVKGAVPEYKAALDLAADAISESNAIKLGGDLFKAGTTRESVRDALAGMSVAEKNAVKQGLRSQIDDTLANVARTITDPNVDAREGIKLLRDFSTRANQTKLKDLLGPKEADALLDKLDKETVAYELRAAISMNSKTAIRQRIQGSVDEQTSSGALELLGSGEPLNASKRFVQLFTGSTADAQTLRQTGIYEEIATGLTATKGRRARAALKLVQRAMDGQKITEQQAAFIGTVVASSAFLVANRQASSLTTR